MIISKKLMFVTCLFSVSTLSLLLASCDSSTDSSQSPLRAKPTLHRVQVITVENQSVSLSQVVSGTLEAVTKVRLYNEESGRIIQLPFHEGDIVKKGTLLIQMDAAFLETDAAKAKASKEQAEIDLSRLKKLLPKKISTAEEVAKAQTLLNLAVAEEKHQSTRLQRASITAPINGVITERLHEPGDMLAAQTQIQSIIDPNSLLLKASIAERWLPLITLNQIVDLRIDALGENKLPAKVIRIHPTVNTETHKGIIEVLLDPAPKGSAAGQFARAELQLSATNRLVIPSSTIHFEPKGSYVYRIVKKDEKNIAEKVYFTQGKQFSSLIEIHSGLTAGDKIVNRGYLGLRDGKQVRIDDTNTDTTSKSVENK